MILPFLSGEEMQAIQKFEIGAEIGRLEPGCLKFVAGYHFVDYT